MALVVVAWVLALGRDGAQYTDVEQVVSALDRNDLDCRLQGDPRAVAAEIAGRTIPLKLGTCELLASGDLVRIAVFESSGDREHYDAEEEGDLALTEVHGLNWRVRLEDPSLADDIRTALGGVVVPAPGDDG